MKDELESLLYKIKSTQEEQIIKILLENYEQLPAMKLDELANLCYCSMTSIRRMLIKLGYEGYREYQLLIKLEISKEKEVIKNEVSEEIMEFINFIKEQKYVYIYGFEECLLSAQYLNQILIEKKYIALHFNQLNSLLTLRSVNIIVIANYQRDENIESVLFRLKNEMACRIAVITSNKKLSSLADIFLESKFEHATSSSDQIDVFNTINRLAKVL